MYAKRNYSVKIILLCTRRNIYKLIAIATTPTVLYVVFDWEFIRLPWQPISMVVSALSFLVSFKNKASYDRLWEARKVWVGIINTFRSLTIMINDFIKNELSEDKFLDNELFMIRK